MKQKEKFDYYLKQRTIAKALWSKIFEKSDREDLKGAAKCLDLWKEPNQLLVESDFEFDLFTEFYLFNYKVNGISAVEKYALQYSSDNDMERMVLESGVNSKSSLFLVNQVIPMKRMVSVIDLLNLDEEYEYMDFSMSKQPAIKGHVLFTRLLPLSPINMLTGATMPFPPGFLRIYPRLFHKLGKKLKTKDKEMKMFQIFWQLFQRHGLSMGNVDIT